MTDANKGVGKARTMGVDEDDSLGLGHAQGAQGRHLPQGDIQCGDRDELRVGQKAWISMRPRLKRLGMRQEGKKSD